MIKFVLFLLLVLITFALIRNLWRGKATPEERSMNIRLGAFAWVTMFFLVTAFVFLPNKQRVLLLIPAFGLAVGFTKFWHDKRTRLRRERAEQTRLDRMKRVN